MQEIHPIEGEREGGGRSFGGGGGADRRLKPHQHQNRQALKCPRCDSLNTKFCYYNNYNLSQPRHFCKSCRRYWTDGGVLRNVPIGGGSRKTKRSKPKHKQTTSATDAATTTTTNLPPREHQHQQQRRREELKLSNSHSSSESSSLTATNTAKGCTAMEAASDYNNSNNTKNTDNILNGIGESKLFSHADSSLNPSMEAGLQLPEQGSSDGVIFSEIGSFASLIDSSNEQLHFGFSNLWNQQDLHQSQQGHGQDQDELWQHQNQKMGHGMGGANGEEMMMMQDAVGRGGGLIDDRTVQAEYSRFGGLDGQGTEEHALFDLDLHSTADLIYWSGQNQWTDQDHSSLYLP